MVLKNPLASAGDARNTRSIPESGRSPGGGHGKPLQYSCLENPMDNGSWQATVHGVTKSQTWLKLLSMHCQRFSVFWPCKCLSLSSSYLARAQWISCCCVVWLDSWVWVAVSAGWLLWTHTKLLRMPRSSSTWLLMWFVLLTGSS